MWDKLRKCDRDIWKIENVCSILFNASGLHDGSLNILALYIYDEIIPVPLYHRSPKTTIAVFYSSTRKRWSGEAKIFTQSSSSIVLQTLKFSSSYSLGKYLFFGTENNASHPKISASFSPL